MKTPVTVSLVLLSLLLVACPIPPKPPEGLGKPKPVTIDKHGIAIPGTSITVEDQNKVKEIFERYSGSLYRVDRYEAGKFKERLGRMKAKEIGQDFVNETAEFAKKVGLTSWTTIIGKGCNPTICPPHKTPAPSPVPKGPSSHTTVYPPRNDDLVKEVAPILEKYSR